MNGSGRTGGLRTASLLDDRGGVAQVEYLVLTALVALPLAAGLLQVGLVLLKLYHFQQRVIRFPIP